MSLSLSLSFLWFHFSVLIFSLCLVSFCFYLLFFYSLPAGTGTHIRNNLKTLLALVADWSAMSDNASAAQGLRSRSSGIDDTMSWGSGSGSGSGSDSGSDSDSDSGLGSGFWFRVWVLLVQAYAQQDYVLAITHAYAQARACAHTHRYTHRNEPAKSVVPKNLLAVHDGVAVVVEIPRVEVLDDVSDEDNVHTDVEILHAASHLCVCVCVCAHARACVCVRACVHACI